jgi:hypothetical protein
MSTVFNTHDTVLFVGGLGLKQGGSFFGGGCTRNGWEDAGNINQDLSKVMDSDSNALSDGSAWAGGGSYPCTVTNSGGYIKITKAGAFTNCRAELIAYVEFENVFPANYSDGRYRVREWIDNDSIVLDETYDDPDNCRLCVGGAFDKVQNAWANSDAKQGYNVIIYCNRIHSVTNTLFAATWNLGTAGGNTANKSFKKVSGFTTQPGDGGQFTLDGEDDAAFTPFGGVRFNSALENVIFENVIVEDSFYGWSIGNSSVAGIYFENCEANSHVGGGWLFNTGAGFMLVGCGADGNTEHGFYLGVSASTPTQCLVKCIASNNTKNGFYSVGGYVGGIALGCLAYGNGKGGTAYSGFYVSSTWGWGFVKDCVAYDNGKHGFEFRNRCPVAINCIAKDNGEWGFLAYTGAALMAPNVKNCCAHGNTSGQFSLVAALPKEDSIETDPQFEDAANGDFRLQSTSPCLNTGISTLGKL